MTKGLFRLGRHDGEEVAFVVEALERRRALPRAVFREINLILVEVDRDADERGRLGTDPPGTDPVPVLQDIRVIVPVLESILATHLQRLRVAVVAKAVCACPSVASYVP